MTGEGLSCTMYYHNWSVMVPGDVICQIWSKKNSREMESSAIDHLGSGSTKIFLEGSIHAQEDDEKLSTPG